MKLTKNKINIKPKKRRFAQGFMDFVLFNPQSFNLLLSMSLVMALIICFSMVLIGLKLQMMFLTIVFSILTLLAGWNVWRFRYMFKAWKRNNEHIINITVADTLNDMFVKKKNKEDK